MTALPTGYTDYNNVLYSPNHFTIRKGFKDWMLAHDFTLGEPLTHEWTASNGASFQIFAYGGLVWTASAGVYLLYVGSYLLGADHLPPVPSAALEPTPTPIITDPNKFKLQRVQDWLGTATLAVYLGVWTVDFRAGNFAPFAADLAQKGVDIAYVKFGEWGNMWYGGDEWNIKEAFAHHGIKVVPYWYCRPQTWEADLAHLVHLSEIFGGVDLDVEEVFLGHGTELYDLTHGLRSALPANLIIADGYGDPRTAFGTHFPMDALRDADCYQPQWYESYIYRVTDAPRWIAALDKHDGECGAEFIRGGEGTSWPIRPCVNSWMVPPATARAVGQWAARFMAGLVIWEYQQLNMAQAQAYKLGLQQGLAAAAISATKAA